MQLSRRSCVNLCVSLASRLRVPASACLFVCFCEKHKARAEYLCPILGFCLVRMLFHHIVVLCDRSTGRVIVVKTTETYCFTVSSASYEIDRECRLSLCPTLSAGCSFFPLHSVSPPAFVYTKMQFRWPLDLIRWTRKYGQHGENGPHYRATSGEFSGLMDINHRSSFARPFSAVAMPCRTPTSMPAGPSTANASSTSNEAARYTMSVTNLDIDPRFCAVLCVDAWAAAYVDELHLPRCIMAEQALFVVPRRLVDLVLAIWHAAGSGSQTVTISDLLPR